MKRSLIAIAILGLVFFFAVRAMADTLTYNGVNPGQGVTVYIESLNNVNTLAGMYNFTLSGGGLYDGSYKGFCVDPATISGQGPYTYFIEAVANGSRFEAAAYLLGKYYGDTSVNSAAAAKVQLAIWELVFDFGGYNLGSGNFRYSGGYSTDVGLLLNEAAEAAAAGDYSSGYYLARSPGENPYGNSPQDFIFRKVPEPGTLVLLGAALFGLGLFSRKRRNG